MRERDDALSHGNRRLLRERFRLCAAHQSLAATLRQDFSHEYVFALSGKLMRKTRQHGIPLNETETKMEIEL